MNDASPGVLCAVVSQRCPNLPLSPSGSLAWDLGPKGGAKTDKVRRCIGTQSKLQIELIL